MHKRKKKLKIVLLSLSVVLLLGAIGGGVWWFFGRNLIGTGTTTSAQPYSPESVSKLIEDGNAADARTVVKNELSKNDTIEVRRQLVKVDEADGNYQDVLDTYSSYINSDSAKLDYQDYQSIAVAYEQVGNKTEAAKYYRKAADAWPKDDPMSEMNVKDLQYRADALEGKISV